MPWIGKKLLAKLLILLFVMIFATQPCHRVPHAAIDYKIVDRYIEGFIEFYNGDDAIDVQKLKATLILSDADARFFYYKGISDETKWFYALPAVNKIPACEKKKLFMFRIPLPQPGEYLLQGCILLNDDTYCFKYNIKWESNLR